MSVVTHDFWTARSVAGFRHWEIEFDKDGVLVGDDSLVTAIDTDPPVELLLFSHGWNASLDSARRLSADMFALIAQQLAPTRAADTAFVTVRWPALLFPEDEPAPDGPTVSAARGASVAESSQHQVRPASPSSGAELAVALAPAFPDQQAELARIGVLLDSRPADPARLTELHRLTSGLVTSPNNAVADDGESIARIGRTRQVLESMAALAAGAGGNTQALGLFDTLWDGARELLRVLSYYEMKSRAGVIGQAGLGPLLRRLRLVRPDLRVHLIGHSFGARLISFALKALPPAPTTPVKSLLLIQAACSHFSFAPVLPFDPRRSGVLASVADRVDGPLLATFSAADRAIGWWYPGANMLARRDNEALEDVGFRWGGLGYDGFQHSGVVELPLGPVGTSYRWQPGTFYRLDANQVINHNLSWLAGAHSDIRKPEIAWAAVTAAGLGL